MNKAFRRILDLIRRTGDRMVVTDPDGEDAFVVMDLDQYEALLGIDDGFMDDFLGDDDTQPTPPTPPAPPAAEAEPPKEIWDVMAPSDEPTWDYAKLTDAERADFEQKFAEAAKATAPVREAKPQEKPKEDDDLGEEQFYLEPIE